METNPEHPETVDGADRWRRIRGRRRPLTRPSSSPEYAATPRIGAFVAGYSYAVPSQPSPSSAVTHDMSLTSGVTLTGDLVVPGVATGLVVFAHGSGSSRLSPRNRMVAEHLNHRGLATLLMDLLTPEEEARDFVTREHRFDISLLGERVIGVIDWVTDHDEAGRLPIACFGASTGAAAALVAAAARPDRISAVVSRGGRPDLAGDALSNITAPTLLIVGERDHEVIDLNRQAAAVIERSATSPPVTIHIVPNATHLFEEPGALEQVQEVTADWLLGILPSNETDD